MEYAVLRGPPPRPGAPPVSALILDRGGRHFNRGLREILGELGFSSVVSVELSDGASEAEPPSPEGLPLSRVILRRRVSQGEMVNLGIQESSGEYCLVIGSDMEPSMPRLGPEYLERLRNLDALCLCPEPRSSACAVLPGTVVPAMDKGGRLRIMLMETRGDGTRSLFPLDYCGIYSRQRFILSGGYDPTIANPWWQKADFGFRAQLWGERILSGTQERLVYSSGLPREEDASPDASYQRFFLKNLALRKRGDAGCLPYAAFLAWAPASGLGPLRALREFQEVRAWVQLNRYRFLNEAASVVDLWGD